MVDLNSMLFEDVPVRDDTVVELPNLVEGKLADLLAAASAPGSRAELDGEQTARALFQSVSDSWAKPRRMGRPVRVAIVAASVATLFGTTTALAAASALPPPAARVVDGALHQVDINVAQPPSAPVAPGPSSGTANGTGTKSVSAGPRPSTRTPAAAAGGCHHTGATGTSAVHAGSEPCGAHKATVAHGVTSKSPGLALYRKLSKEAASNHRGAGNKATGTVPKSSTGNAAGRGGNKATGGGSGSAGGTGSGTGGTRGGNQGTGGQGGTGTGGSRGGNHGTGSGSGTGGKQGGNRGTGSGGKGGTGKKKGGHRPRHGDKGSGAKHHGQTTVVQKQQGAVPTITYGENASAD